MDNRTVLTGIAAEMAVGLFALGIVGGIPPATWSTHAVPGPESGRPRRPRNQRR